MKSKSKLKSLLAAGLALASLTSAAGAAAPITDEVVEENLPPEANEIADGNNNRFLQKKYVIGGIALAGLSFLGSCFALVKLGAPKSKALDHALVPPDSEPPAPEDLSQEDGNFDPSSAAANLGSCFAFVNIEAPKSKAQDHALVPPDSEPPAPEEKSQEDGNFDPPSGAANPNVINRGALETVKPVEVLRLEREMAFLSGKKAQVGNVRFCFSESVLEKAKAGEIEAGKIEAGEIEGGEILDIPIQTVKRCTRTTIFRRLKRQPKEIPENLSFHVTIIKGETIIYHKEWTNQYLDFFTDSLAEGETIVVSISKKK
jgi:hypothetical protein